MIVFDTTRTYRTDLSEWSILRLLDDGTWTELNPRSSIDEEFISTTDVEEELQEKINGYINEKEFIGAVLAVGIFRRLEEDDDATLAAVHSLHRNLVHDKDELHNAEQTRLSEWLAANGATGEEVKDAEFEENKAADDSSGYDPDK